MFHPISENVTVVTLLCNKVVMFSNSWLMAKNNARHIADVQ